MISDQIALHSVQLPILIQRNVSCKYLYVFYDFFLIAKRLQKVKWFYVAQLVADKFSAILRD